MLVLTLTLLFAELQSNYYTKVKIIRKFIKTRGNAPKDYIARSNVIKDVDFPSIFGCGTLDIYAAANATEPQPVLMWIHGGGYVGGDKTCIKSWAHILACETHIAVVSINYRLAPQQPYPAPVIQISEAFEFLARNEQKFNLDLDRIFLGGDSAGSQISSQYAALVYNGKLRRKMNLTPPVTREQLKGIILCCGFYNMDTVLKSHFPAIKTFIQAYTADRNITSYERRDELSTVKNLDEGYCDTLITCGYADPFLGQTFEMIDALDANGIYTDFYLPQNRKSGHEYQFTTTTAEADTALRKTVEFIEQRK